MRIGQGLSRRAYVASSAIDGATKPDADKPSDPWAVHLAELSDIAYGPLKDAKAWLEANGCQAIEPFEKWTTNAIAYVKDGQPCLVFRGSQEKIDFVTDVACLYWGNPAQHLGFYLSWVLVRARVLKWVRMNAASSGGLFLAGHSLGGAVATVAAADLASCGVSVARVVTFGSPRPGTFEFAKTYARLGLTAKTSRFECGQDGVCVIPPIGLYAHVVNRIELPVDRLAPPGSNVNYQWIESIIDHLAGLSPELLLIKPLHALFNPLNTALGLKAPYTAYACFLLLLLAVHILLNVGGISTSLLHRRSPWLPMWVVTLGVLFVVAQQFYYALLWGLNSWVRLLLSLALSVALFSLFPVNRVEAILVPVVIVLAALLMFVVNRFATGIPDHFMAKTYLKSMKATYGREAISKWQSETANQKMFENFSKMTPEMRARFTEAFNKIKSGPH